MNGLSTISIVAASVTGLYGAIALVGGIMGYVKADSMASLIAGGVSGIFLLACAAGMWRFPFISPVAAVVISIALLARFGGVVSKQENLREFFDKTAGITALLMIMGGVLVVTVATLALLSINQSPKAP